MIPMTGEIGVFYQDGGQVGGFKYWTAIHNRATKQTVVRASEFWINKEFNGNLQAEFLYRTDGGLETAYKTKAKVKLPKYELGKYTKKTIDIDCGEFIWDGV